MQRRSTNSNGPVSLEDWSLWVLAVLGLLLALTLLVGCAQVQPKAVSDLVSPEAAKKLKGVVQLQGQVQAAVWGNFLQNLLKDLQVNTREDTLGPGATQVKTAPVINVNPVVTTKLLEVDGVVIAVVTIAAGAIALFILRERWVKREAKDWRDVAGAVTDAVEQCQAKDVKQAVHTRTRNRPRVRAKLDGDLRDKGYLSMESTPPVCP